MRRDLLLSMTALAMSSIKRPPRLRSVVVAPQEPEPHEPEPDEPSLFRRVDLSASPQAQGALNEAAKLRRERRAARKNPSAYSVRNACNV